MSKKLTQEEFLARAKKIHGNKYDYSKSIFVGVDKKLTIICSKHGEFEQTPSKHVREKQKCPKCVGKKLTTQELIIKFIKVHGVKYDYSKFVYKNAKAKSKISCLKHGVFMQSSYKHLNGQGCPKCAGKNLNTLEIIENFKEIHGEKYDYSEVKYKNENTCVKIKCNKHGHFYQMPRAHKQGSGCHICSNSKGEHMIFKFFTDNKISFERQKKFENCKDIKNLPFDFYVPKYNLLIEYDGEQHFVPLNHWKGDEGLKQIQKRDKIKNEFCKKEGINILRISYNDYNNIDKILNDWINK